MNYSSYGIKLVDKKSAVQEGPRKTFSYSLWAVWIGGEGDSIALILSILRFKHRFFKNITHPYALKYIVNRVWKEYC